MRITWHNFVHNRSPSPPSDVGIELGSREPASRKLGQPSREYWSGVYDRAVRTDSYKAYLEKTRILADKIPGVDESGLNSFRTILDGLLEPDEETVQAVLEDTINQERPEILELVWDYFASSQKACALCGIVLESIHEAKRDCESMKTAVENLPGKGDVGDGKHQEAVQRLYDLAESQKQPFGEQASHQLQAVRDCYNALGNKLEEKKGMIDKRINWVWYCRGGSAIVVAVFAGATIVAVVAATHGLAGLAAAPVAVASVPNKGKKRYGCRRLRIGLLKRQKAHLEALCRGMFMVLRMLDTITCLVARLQNDLASNKHSVKLGWMHREQLMSVQELRQQLTRNHTLLGRQLSDLEEQVILFGSLINKVRKAVIREFSPCEKKSSQKTPSSNENASQEIPSPLV